MATTPTTKPISQAEEISELFIDPNEHLLGVSDSGALTKTLWSALKRWVHGNIDRAYGGAGSNDIVIAGAEQAITNKTISNSLLTNCSVYNSDGGTDYDIEDIISDMSGGSRTAESIFMKYGQLSTTDPIAIVIDEILLNSEPSHSDVDDTIFIENLLSVKLFLVSGTEITPADEKLLFDLNAGIVDASTGEYTLKNISIQKDQDAPMYLLVVRYIHSEIPI